jgi:raffinose/stachyose/melibiose transport system substrate-binding protein
MNITNEPGMDLQKKSPSVDSLYDVRGKKYGFMISGNGGPIPVYYNKKYFAKLNLTPPKTMDEFFKVCEVIKADGIDPIVFGNKDRWPLEFFFRHRGYSGMLDKYPEWGLALYNGDVKPSEFFKKELELTELLVNKGYIGKASLTLTWPQSVPYFVDGKAAMLPQGPWVPSLPEIKDADPAKFELGCFTSSLEATNGKKYTTGEADRTLVISATTKNPNEAKKLLNFFIAPENLRTYLEANTITTFINLDYKVDPVLQEHVKNLSSSDYILVLKQKANITPAFADATWNAYQNIQAGSTAEEESKKLDTEFEKTKSQMVVNE